MRDSILISASSQCNNVHVSGEAHYSQRSPLCEVSFNICDTCPEYADAQESAIISDCLEEGIRPSTVQECYSRNNMFIRRRKWRKPLNLHEITRDDRCNKIANRSRRVPLFCFCCDNKVREITVGPTKCIFPRWRTIFTRALQFSPRQHPRGLNLRFPGKVLSVSLPVYEHRTRCLLKYLTGCKSAKKVCLSETVYDFIEMICTSEKVALVHGRWKYAWRSVKHANLQTRFDWTHAAILF